MSAGIVTIEDAMTLYWKLVSVTVDVELLKLAGDDPDRLRECELEERRIRLKFQAALIPGRVYQ